MAWEGAFGIAPKEAHNCVMSGAFVVYELNRERIDEKFLDFFFKVPDHWQGVGRQSTGTNVRRQSLHPNQFEQAEIPLPPLAEQGRLVARIEELAAQIREARSIRAETETKVEVLRSKVMDGLFQLFSDKRVPIGSAFRVTTGGTPSRGNPAYWDGDVKWVSSGEVAFCRIRDTAEKITELGVAESNAKVYPPQTVLIAMIGQGKTRGQCAILDCHAATNQNVAGIHVYATEHLPEFVYWWLFFNYQQSRSTEIGTAQPALSGERVKQMLIPLPSPADQRRIVAELDGLRAEIDALKRLQTETAAELNALLPAILDKAFKGEL